MNTNEIQEYKKLNKLYNEVTKTNDPTAHAEILTLISASEIGKSKVHYFALAYY